MTAIELVNLQGVGQTTIEKLKKLNIFSFKDLLLHLPFRYIDKTKITTIRMVSAKEHAVIVGTIMKVNYIRGKKSRLQLTLQDSTGSIIITFFHFYPKMQQELVAGLKLHCFGIVNLYAGQKQMVHPEYQILKVEHNYIKQELTPIYASTEGLTQKQLQNIVKIALEWLATKNIQSIPLELLPKELNIDLKSALQMLHFPSVRITVEQLDKARQRIALEELLAHHLKMKKNKKLKSRKQALSMEPNFELTTKLESSLPFSLTAAQKKAFQEISLDLTKKNPMMRLLQGDVGCGKTLVAALSALLVIANNYQVALLAPTEILASQHYQNFLSWFEFLGLNVALFTGKKHKGQKQMLEQLKNGGIHLAIGTHALLEDKVEFKNLALAIIDEQHRFGVQQRAALHNKSLNTGFIAHHLILSATPIPRSMALTFYADLEYSSIKEMPSGRMNIKTIAIGENNRSEVLQKVKDVCVAGQQVYWVCTLINESEHIDSTPAINAYEQLQQELADFKVELIHGKLKPKDKESIMQRFKSGETKIIVATTVIEVGVDVPNAALIVIQNPERLGLAQLHQLRGRVGRGSYQSYCILFYGYKLSSYAKARIKTLLKYNDGFKIAEEDLNLRGPGEILGVRQSGEISFKVADIVKDKHIFNLLPAIANKLEQSYFDIIPILLNRWLPQSLV